MPIAQSDAKDKIFLSTNLSTKHNITQLSL